MQQRFEAFIMEQFPFAYEKVMSLWQKKQIETPQKLLEALNKNLKLKSKFNLETTPFITSQKRFNQEKQALIEAVEGFFEREAIKTKFSNAEKIKMLRGMILTRAVDNQLKQLFLSGEIKYEGKSFQGKGFRSLGQEAIYAAALKLYHGTQYTKEGVYKGDVVAPLIRDLGVALAFTDDVLLPLNAQAGKDGPFMWGKDLHVGDLSRGVLPPAAPLSIATCTAMGMAFAFALKKEKRIALSFIGEGGSSLGEWHEAINMAAVYDLPIIFCLENNQTALSTPVLCQSKARVFGEKARGYGLPHVSVDGTDPEAVAATFAWGANRARSKKGPCLIELISMRMCGHAHHDDMLYLGKEPALSFEYFDELKSGYINQKYYQLWSKRDPIKTYAQKLIEGKICSKEDVESYKKEAVQRCHQALTILKQNPWPKKSKAKEGVFCNLDAEGHVDLVEAEDQIKKLSIEISLEPQPEFSPKGATFLEAICLGVQDILESHPNTFILGEDVGPPYGNAFMVFKTIMEKWGHRFLNTPIAEGAIIGACVGMALENLRPIGEMQFNDFVASGFNQLVNNAAKMHYRTKAKIPMVLRMPWGGLRHAGPYHSQDTSPWFYRVPGLKIVVPSTPHDARALLKAAVLDDNPVLFYEHIALYRDPSIRQELGKGADKISIGKAAFRRLGQDLSIVAYGAFVHKALWCADVLSKEDGVLCDVLDLRTLVPLDLAAVLATTKRTGKVLLVGEDTKQGSILESIASQIAEKAFSFLDAPIRVLGSLNTPVPYSPPLEEGFLVSNEYLLKSARELLMW